MFRYLSVAVSLITPLTAVAAETWHGRIQCAAIPGVSTLPLNGDFEMVADGARLSYNRPVHVADQASLSGVQERGTGALTGKTIKLQGGASGSGYSYTSVYQGQMNGGKAVLDGEQVWISRSSSPFHRACHITLKR